MMLSAVWLFLFPMDVISFRDTCLLGLVKPYTPISSFLIGVSRKDNRVDCFSGQHL